MFTRYDHLGQNSDLGPESTTLSKQGKHMHISEKYRHIHLNRHYLLENYLLTSKYYIQFLNLRIFGVIISVTSFWKYLNISIIYLFFLVQIVNKKIWNAYNFSDISMTIMNKNLAFNFSKSSPCIGY